MVQRMTWFLYSKKNVFPQFPVDGRNRVCWQIFGFGKYLGFFPWQFTTDVRSQVSIQLHVASNFLAGNTTQFPKCSCREILQNYDCFINFQVWLGEVVEPFRNFSEVEVRRSAILIFRFPMLESFLQDRKNGVTLIAWHLQLKWYVQNTPILRSLCSQLGNFHLSQIFSDFLPPDFSSFFEVPLLPPWYLNPGIHQ